MKIRNLKKAMKNSSGFLTLSVNNKKDMLKLGGYCYPVNEWDRIEYHKRHITIYGPGLDDVFITFFYTDIHKVYIHR